RLASEARLRDDGRLPTCGLPTPRRSARLREAPRAPRRHRRRTGTEAASRAAPAPDAAASHAPGPRAGFPPRDTAPPRRARRGSGSCGMSDRTLDCVDPAYRYHTGGPAPPTNMLEDAPSATVRAPEAEALARERFGLDASARPPPSGASTTQSPPAPAPTVGRSC